MFFHGHDRISTPVCVCMFSRVGLFVTPIDSSLPGSSVHRISQTRILGGLPFSPPGDLPGAGIEPPSPVSPALLVDSSPLSHRGSLTILLLMYYKKTFEGGQTRDRSLRRFCSYAAKVLIAHTDERYLF